MPAPTASAPGYGMFRGRVACDCLIAWLPVYESELQRRGIIGGALPIAQLVGDAPASAGTHYGGAFDLWMLVPASVWVAREMGADATWIRDWPGNRHTHGVLRGCPHNTNARYQIAAVDAGFNGLGTGGRGGPDDGPRPLSGRTWQQGIEWAEEQQMADYAGQLSTIERGVQTLLERSAKAAERQRKILAELDALDVLVADDATAADLAAVKQQVRKLRTEVAAWSTSEDDPA